MLNAECLKLNIHVLPTLVIHVIPQSAQFRSSDILSPSLELLECSKSVMILTHVAMIQMHISFLFIPTHIPFSLIPFFSIWTDVLLKAVLSLYL
jgi:hypothetical protein